MNMQFMFVFLILNLFCLVNICWMDEQMDERMDE